MRFERTDAERRHDAIDIGRDVADRVPDELLEDAGADALTEASAADRFARRYGDAVRFDHRRQCWLIRDRHRWAPDQDAAITRLGIEFARQWQADALDLANRERRDPVMRFALSLERREKLSNLLALAKAVRPIANRGDRWDADPWLIAAPNGVLDLRTTDLRPGDPHDGITLSTRVAYDPHAACPRWERFLREIFADDALLVDFVHRAVGYSITGITTEQVLFMCDGTGSNGKGTFVNTIADTVGDYAWNMPFATIEMRDRAAIPNDVAALPGRRFVSASETNDGTRLNEARIKALTGCDPITARFLHSEFFTFEPVAKFWLSVNHKPIVRDDSHGFWRRIRLIPFQQRFDVNPSLTAELRAEAAGILTWAVRGCLAWQTRGLEPPAIVTDATRQYEQDSDPLAAFLAEACDLDAHAEVAASDIYDAYKKWADRLGLGDRERLTSTMFGRKMAERFTRMHTRAGKVYKGLARGVL